jgi:hypothetical protein
MPTISKSPTCSRVARQAGRASAIVFGIALCLTFARAAVDDKTASAGLTAAQIVEKNVAARGGLTAWRGLQSLSLSGKMDAGSGDSAVRSANFVRTDSPASHKKPPPAPPADQAAAEASKQVQLPFRLEVKRPRKSRLELEFAGKTAVQVYDGAEGWKVRPFLNRKDVEPFSADELKTEAYWTGIDGPLVDYSAKGSKVTLEGTEPVEGRNAYKLKFTMQDGTVQHIWIDARSFLDVKVEGAPRRMDGRMHNVYVYQRDFRTVQGLMIPFLLETAVDGYRDTHKMVIEKAAVNPQLSDARFTKPGGA